MADFEADLALLGFKKAGFARLVGVDRTTVSRWGAKPPRWALAYLRLLKLARQHHEMVFKE